MGVWLLYLSRANVEFKFKFVNIVNLVYSSMIRRDIIINYACMVHVWYMYVQYYVALLSHITNKLVYFQYHLLSTS